MKNRIKMFDDVDGGITLDEAFKDFIFEKQSNNVAKDTIRNYNLSYNKYCNYYNLDDKAKVDEAVSESNIIRWKNSMLKAELSPASINHYLRDFRTFINYLIGKEYIKPMKVELIRYQEETEKAFKTEMIPLLLKKPLKSDSYVVWRTWAIVNWVCATGNREATVCEVRVGDVDFRSNRITLRHTKSKKASTLPLSTSLATCLKEYIRYFRRDSRADDFLFPSFTGEQLTTNALRKSFTNYCAERGVEQHNFHGLRHWFAIDWINGNGNLYQLQVLLGHSTPAMTQKYLRTYGVEFNDFEEFNPLDKMNKDAKRRKGITRYE